MAPKHCRPPYYISLRDSAFLSQSVPYHHLLTHLQHPVPTLIGHSHSDSIVMEDAVERSPLSSCHLHIPQRWGNTSLLESKPSTWCPDPSVSALLRLNPHRCPLSLLPYPFLLPWIVPACKHTRPQEHPPLALWSHHPIFLLPFTAELLKELGCFLHHHFLFP